MEAENSVHTHTLLIFTKTTLVVSYKKKQERKQQEKICKKLYNYKIHIVLDKNLIKTY